MSKINGSHKEVISEVLEKTDQVVMDRFHQINNKLKEYQNSKKELEGSYSYKIAELDKKIKKLQKDWDNLVERVYLQG